YDGNFFVRNLDTSMEQSTKRGKRLHRTQYIQYCTWAHALMKKEVGPEDVDYSFPKVVLKYIRNVTPGDVKGEIREVCLSVSIHTLS
ncbi:hypothetical protein pdam_00024397, partial [Pocillopora damicornis]